MKKIIFKEYFILLQIRYIAANAPSLCDGRELPGSGFLVVSHFVDTLTACFPQQTRLIA